MQADILSAEEIKKYLTKERKNNIAVFDTVDSTNTILKNWCAEGKARPGDCVTADCQTKGRGRRGIGQRSRNLSLFFARYRRRDPG